jgi:hypothetical protein
MPDHVDSVINGGAVMILSVWQCLVPLLFFLVCVVLGLRGLFRRQEEDVDSADYVPPPPNAAHHVQVRYIYRGRGLPLPYSLDDDSAGASESKATGAGGAT